MPAYRIRLKIPVSPVRGDTITAGAETTRVGRWCRRRRLGENRFAVDAADRKVYDIVPTAASRTWRAVSELPASRLRGASETNRP